MLALIPQRMHRSAADKQYLPPLDTHTHTHTQHLIYAAALYSQNQSYLNLDEITV